MSVKPGFQHIRREDSDETRWIVVGKEGAVDFHCSHTDFADCQSPWPQSLGRTGGLEVHYSVPPDYMRDKAPHHEHCWILGGKCWHDGSSLYASEVLIPLLERDGEEAIWRQLQHEYAKYLGIVETEA